ncbi:lipid-binding SYLF domain-containing protein [Jejuia pallidilutea]|jgi:lipid-binding SYLF domain-containing protein|uniref:Lipid-binding SYLF domain-containing protein n=1 Tax=Jejuia pallidilutea TaxID=504487 RepID=A0A362XD28_9FLAO|nr:lipid-binding SYLF domain-containing protein [Jejuia pallidilutea]PQV49023.1 lipid-binding SYLF domain-containing protein [Jejuia pallidilutea]
MKNLKIVWATCLLFITVMVAAQNEKDKKIMADAEKAKATLIEKDAGIEKFFENSSGYAIFPNVGKGGLIIGGASGNGVVYENGGAVGMTSLKKVNIGLQAGGQAVIEVIFFETDAALAKFKEGNYEFSAQVSAVVADEGKSKNVDYDDGVLVFALPKAGFMADISVGGQKFEYDAFK